MLNKLKQRKSEGFTIIEVMIVLAIAGLIMVVVFLAVPALQRSSRNTQRKTDVSNLLSAISTYESNQGGALPSTAQFNSAFPDAAQMSYYTTAANITWTNNTSKPSAAPADPKDGDKVIIASYMKCNGNAMAPGDSQRQVAALYDYETASGVSPICTSE